MSRGSWNSSMDICCCSPALGLTGRGEQLAAVASLSSWCFQLIFPLTKWVDYFGNIGFKFQSLVETILMRKITRWVKTTGIKCHQSEFILKKSHICVSGFSQVWVLKELYYYGRGGWKYFPHWKYFVNKNDIIIQSVYYAKENLLVLYSCDSSWCGCHPVPEAWVCISGLVGIFCSPQHVHLCSTERSLHATCCDSHILS